MSTNQEPSGIDLKLERVAARVQQKHIAEAMGVSPSRVSAIESLAIVTVDTAARYRTAIDTCLLRRTSKAAA